jgi:hypothetical protein
MDGAAAAAAPNMEQDDADDDDDDDNDNNDNDDVIGGILAQARHRHPTFDQIYGAGVREPTPAAFVKLHTPYTNWCHFCQERYPGRLILQVPPFKGLGLFASPSFRPNQLPLPDTWDVVLITEFCEWMFAARNATMYLMSITVNFLNKHSKAKAAAYGWNRMIPSVGSIVAVADYMRQAMQRTATLARDTGQDLQANLDNSISAAQIESMLRGGLHTVDGVLNGMKPLARYQFCAMLCKGFLTLNRGDEFRKLMMGHCLVRVIEVLGSGGGTEAAHMITNEAKANSVGNLEYTGFVTHINPLQDAAGWDGVCILQRYGPMGEPSPNFALYGDYCHRPFYRAHNNRNNALAAATMDQHWRKQFNAHEVCCAKLTHQPCRQGQQQLDNLGVNVSHIARLAGYKQRGNDSAHASRVQQQSYLTNPPIQALVAAAGGNWRFPECHNPGWANVNAATQAVLDRLVDAVMPTLRGNYAHVCALYDAHRTYEEKKELRLFMAKGSVSYFKFTVEKAFLMMAAKPLRKESGKWTLQMNSGIIHDLSDKFNEDSIFSHGVFQSHDFEQLKILVAAAQERETQLLTYLPLATETALYTNIRHFLQHQYGAVEQRFASMDQRYGVLEQSVANLPAAVANLVLTQLLTILGNQFPAAAQLPLPAQAALPPLHDGNAHVPLADALDAAPGIPLPNVPDDPRIVMPVHDRMPEQCTSLREFWDEYDVGFAGKVAFKKMEAWWGTAWRWYPRRRKGWWTEHRSLYGLVLYFKKYPHPGRSLEDALAMAEPIYQQHLIRGRRNLTTSNQSIRDYMRDNLPIQDVNQTIDELLTEHQDEANW